MRVSEGAKHLTIRLACIDPPETAQRPYGAASCQSLQELAPVGSVVTLRPQTIGKHGRTVAEMICNGQNVNLAMVANGSAFAYRKSLSACDQSAYLGAEAAAQRQRVGVWAVPGGIQRPWDLRHGTRPQGAPFVTTRTTSLTRLSSPATTPPAGAGAMPAQPRLGLRDGGTAGSAENHVGPGYTTLKSEISWNKIQIFTT